MSKFVNKEALYFRQVAAVLGENEAERHLQIVIDSLPPYEHPGFSVEDVPLNNAFVWRYTPQGFDFWSLIELAANEAGVGE